MPDPVLSPAIVAHFADSKNHIPSGKGRRARRREKQVSKEEFARAAQHFTGRERSVLMVLGSSAKAYAAGLEPLRKLQREGLFQDSQVSLRDMYAEVRGTGYKGEDISEKLSKARQEIGDAAFRLERDLDVARGAAADAGDQRATQIDGTIYYLLGDRVLRYESKQSRVSATSFRGSDGVLAHRDEMVSITKGRSVDILHEGKNIQIWDQGSAMISDGKQLVAIDKKGQLHRYKGKPGEMKTRSSYEYTYGYNALSGEYEWHWGWVSETYREMAFDKTAIKDVVRMFHDDAGAIMLEYKNGTVGKLEAPSATARTSKPTFPRSI